MTKWHWIVGIVCLLFIAYFGYIGYLETRVNTPFDAKKVSSLSTRYDCRINVIVLNIFFYFLMIH